jgi:hypothetical protein
MKCGGKGSAVSTKQIRDERRDEGKNIKEAHKGRRASVEQTLARVVGQKTIRVKRWQHSGSIPTLNREVRKERRGKSNKRHRHTAEGQKWYVFTTAGKSATIITPPGTL